MTYTPDTATVRRLATAILVDHARDIDLMSVCEAIENETAGLGEQDAEALQQAVHASVGRATVQVSWPAAA